MQTAREWLASKGLAKLGVRGPFSTEAHVALKGYLDGGGQLSDWNQSGRIAPNKTSKTRKIKINGGKATAPKVTTGIEYVREENTLSIIDSFGFRINLDHCVAGHSIRRCYCAKIEPPKFLNAQSYELIKR